jgi:hypothetical protein
METASRTNTLPNTRKHFPAATFDPFTPTNTEDYQMSTILENDACRRGRRTRPAYLTADY